MKFEDVKNIKVGDKLKVVNVILCSNLQYETNRGNLEKGDNIILTVKSNDCSDYKPFRCSINVNGVDKGVEWWISYEAVELVKEEKPTFKSGDKVVRTGRSFPDLSVINGEVYTVKDYIKGSTNDAITLEGCFNISGHNTMFGVSGFEMLGDESNTDYTSLNIRNGGEVYPIQDILGESIHVEVDNRATPSGGGSASYYKKEIPKGLLEKWKEKGVIETSEVIRLFLGNDFTHGNIFKASCRIIGSRNGGGKKGVSEEYDLDKQVYFVEDDAAWNEMFK